MTSICYSAMITRPDIAKATSKLSEFFINSGFDHLYAVDHYFRYLYATRHLEIQYSIEASIHMIVQAFVSTDHIFQTMTDVSFDNYPDRKNDEGYVFQLYDDLIDWTSRKQSTITTSIIEAELLSLLHASKKLIWWSNLFQKLMFKTEHNLIIYNDNLQTIRLLNSKIPRLKTKLRHVDMFQCWLRQEVQKERINVDFVSTAKMMIDDLLKLLPSQKHQVFIQQLDLKDLKREIMKSKVRSN